MLSSILPTWRHVRPGTGTIPAPTHPRWVLSRLALGVALSIAFILAATASGGRGEASVGRPVGGAPASVATKLTAVYFATLPPDSALPDAKTCARRVRRSLREPRPDNTAANRRTGVAGVRISGASDEANARLASRIDGNFVGTTDEILQWGACKWGFDENIVRATAVVESWWRQATRGNWSGTTHESFGLLQVRAPVHVGTYPWSERSTAFNVDYALAWRRSCFEGHFAAWVPASARGDEWGCLGLWASGRWYDGYAQSSISDVRQHLRERTWLRPGF
ncbi:MAG: hypothetical protein HYY04_10085 [Chloroflexi bacterium]|nr:hypothetical protein [Chloroflexota bacterium]